MHMANQMTALDELLERVKELTADRREFKCDDVASYLLFHYFHLLPKLARIVEAQAEALEFYADKSHWVSRTGKIGIGLIDTVDRESGDPLGEYNFAGGKKAREAQAKVQRLLEEKV
jgi:hypothetical protein